MKDSPGLVARACAAHLLEGSVNTSLAAGGGLGAHPVIYLLATRSDSESTVHDRMSTQQRLMQMSMLEPMWLRRPGGGGDSPDGGRVRGGGHGEAWNRRGGGVPEGPTTRAALAMILGAALVRIGDSSWGLGLARAMRARLNQGTCWGGRGETKGPDHLEQEPATSAAISDVGPLGQSRSGMNRKPRAQIKAAGFGLTGGLKRAGQERAERRRPCSTWQIAWTVMTETSGPVMKQNVRESHEIR